MLVLGERKGAYILEIPKEIWADSIPEKLYELHMNTSGITANEIELAKELIKGLNEKFGATVKYMSIDNDSVVVQLEGSPFVWAEVIAWLPSVLSVFGLILIGISVFTVLASIPSWAWGLLAVGTLLVIVSPMVTSSLKKR